MQTSLKLPDIPIISYYSKKSGLGTFVPKPLFAALKIILQDKNQKELHLN